MIESVKSFEIKIILEAIKNSTDYFSYKEILLNIGKELLKEQEENIKKFKNNPKKYGTVIKNIEKYLNIIINELGGYKNE
ncbi:hypothetical protein [[Clostridium] colinum]|uniref:hypothetical protein n=1 Tax=[Clostridium] colinum TaxID=36835 RepID=UPI00202465E5|nr:hypothetical protein [[Clostridium] colinum]